MTIEEVANALGPAGLAPPELNALTSDANNYTALLLQPVGEVDATGMGIKNRHGDLAESQFGRFLADAAVSQPDLVITPEYSVPWHVLKDAISGANAGPGKGKLWVLGCESIRYSEFQQMKLDLANIAEVIVEPLQADDAKFVDPLAYVFRAPINGHHAASKLVVLVQFKTHPMVDPHDFERNNLQTGQRVYRFGTAGTSVSLLTFICSDFLGVDDSIAKSTYKDALIINVQLNGKRQHATPLNFRERILGLSGDWTELITLNWARGTKVFIDGTNANVGKFAGSAWYLKAEKIDLADSVIASNHRNGFYYTRFDPRPGYAAFFNFSQATFRLTASKVVRIGVPGPAGRRRGPQLDVAKTWDGVGADWSEGTALDDGFLTVHVECGGASGQIRAVYDICPVASERLISLCAGDAILQDKWYIVNRLHSFGLPQDELVRRLTFCQPTHTTSVEFRRARFRRCGLLWNALNDIAHLPAVLNDVSPTFKLTWSADKPYQNIRGKDDEAATVVYPDIVTREDAESTHGAIRRCLEAVLPEDIEGRENRPHSKYRAKQRIAVWYSDRVGQRQLYVKIPSIVDAQEDPADIRRAS